MAIFNKIGVGILLAGLLACRVGATSVQINDLPSFSLDGIGLSSVFDSSVWRGSVDVTSLSERVKTVGRLPLGRTEREVLRQLLITDTSAEPALADGDGSFWKARVEALASQGFYEEIIALVDQVSVELQTSNMKKQRAEALFGSGQIHEACREVMIPLWGEQENAVRAACAFYQGTADEARLAFDVYREGGGQDAWITAASTQLFEGKGKAPEGLPEIWAVGLAGAAFGEDVLSGMSRGMLRAVALHSKVSVDVRVAAAEKTILSQSDWSRVLSGVEKTNVTEKVQKNTVSERIQLYQKTFSAPEEKRVDAIHQLIKAVREANVTEAWAPVLTDMVLGVDVQSDRESIAADMIVINAWANDVTAAHGWYVVLADKNAVAALRLSPILNAMGAGVPKSVDPLVRACVADGNCDVVLRDIPFYFPVSPDVALSIRPTSFGYAGFVTGAIQKQMAEGQIGNGLLNGLELLSRSHVTERPLVETMAKVLPHDLGDALLRERLLRGLSSR